MFGWATNSRIDTVLEIGIAVVYSNVNLLFLNSDNSYYFAIVW
jgi:hypothetical protein